jgi:hypothetical protein
LSGKEEEVTSSVMAESAWASKRRAPHNETNTPDVEEEEEETGEEGPVRRAARGVTSPVMGEATDDITRGGKRGRGVDRKREEKESERESDQQGEESWMV